MPYRPKPSKHDQRLADKRIAGYQIVRVIGEGGMGLVFEAEQEHPRRIVALKVIKPGFAKRAQSPRAYRNMSCRQLASRRVSLPGMPYTCRDDRAAASAPSGLVSVEVSGCPPLRPQRLAV
jgi:serine/threonine protein kinase